MVNKKVEVSFPVKAVEDQGEPQIYVVVATFLPLKSFWKILAFLRLSAKVEKQLRVSRGLVRYALRTDMPRKRFWTLSVWTSGEDMATFSRSEPHLTAMKKFYEWGTDRAAIAEWTTDVSALDWAEAEKKLDTPMFHYKYAEGKRLVHAPGSKTITPDAQNENGEEK